MKRQHRVSFTLYPEGYGIPREFTDATMTASYRSMSAGEFVVRALEAARTGEFAPKPVMVLDPNNPLFVQLNGLVELHLKQFLAALLEVLKRETSKCEFHVLRPAVEFTLHLPDSDFPKVSSHEEKDAPSDLAGSSVEQGGAA